jgi:hypothetical protein
MRFAVVAAAVGMGRMHQALGRTAAAGEGTGSRFFRKRQDGGVGPGCLAWHIIHPIAIGKGLPATKTWITSRGRGDVLRSVTPPSWMEVPGSGDMSTCIVSRPARKPIPSAFP